MDSLKVLIALPHLPSLCIDAVGSGRVHPLLSSPPIPMQPTATVAARPLSKVVHWELRSSWATSCLPACFTSGNHNSQFWNDLQRWRWSKSKTESEEKNKNQSEEISITRANHGEFHWSLSKRWLSTYRIPSDSSPEWEVSGQDQLTSLVLSLLVSRNSYYLEISFTHWIKIFRPP